METIDSFLRFLNSYPTWAKVALACATIAILLILVFAPRDFKLVKGSPEAWDRRYFLAIRGIALFPDDPSADVQVVISVNGVEFNFPSTEGVEWMKVGPFMSQKTVEIQQSETYAVSFRMMLRCSRTVFAGALQSKERVQLPVREIRFANTSLRLIVPALPYKAAYDLFEVADGVRSAAVRATIRFEVFST